MNTPICDFIERYASDDKVRLHVPGHKGKAQLGFEKYDITEINGADSLYHADGIILESENNASKLFDSGKTLYSCEGSSLCIRAMLYLAKLYSGKDKGYIIAGRNAHSSLISASALIDFDIKWIYPDNESYMSCTIKADTLENMLRSVEEKPFCVYVTSPDYLGVISDIKAISQVCHRYNVLLIVDNAHGAYLKMLNEDIHPLTLGADMCCDSAHKTLPVLTGGAYLHISKDAPSFLMENGRNALSLFGSTSPSYLILASLDRANKYLSQGFKEKLNHFVLKVNELKKKLCYMGIVDSEPLKITIKTSKIGYRGTDFAKALEEKGLVCEFCDPDYIVLMLSPENGEASIEKIENELLAIKVHEEIKHFSTKLVPPVKKMSIREATFKKKRLVKIENALGKVLASSSIICPPAVSLIVSGEEFNKSIIEESKYYGINSCYIVDEPSLTQI